MPVYLKILSNITSEAYLYFKKQGVVFKFTYEESTVSLES